MEKRPSNAMLRHSTHSGDFLAVFFSPQDITVPQGWLRKSEHSVNSRNVRNSVKPPLRTCQRRRGSQQKLFNTLHGGEFKRGKARLSERSEQAAYPRQGYESRQGGDNGLARLVRRAQRKKGNEFRMARPARRSAGSLVLRGYCSSRLPR